MEVCLKSSWFLLLLGFAFFVATLQEPDDCPTPDQVSCTTGSKCNVDEDCDKHMICCSNPCYTKRCIPNTKGVQGGKESEGPSESECRPYIEKALKELETGEAADTQQESSEKYDSAEDIPTVEITDDSSHQEQDADGDGDEHDTDDGAESDETSEDEIPIEKAVEETVQEQSEEAADDKESEEDGESVEDKDADEGSNEQQEESVEDEAQQSDEEQEKTISDEKQSAEEASKEDETKSAEDAKDDSGEEEVVKDAESTEENEESVEVQASEEIPSAEDIKTAEQADALAQSKESAEQQGQADAESHEDEDGDRDEESVKREQIDESEEVEEADATESKETKEESDEEADKHESDEDQQASAEEADLGEEREKSAEEQEESAEESVEKDITAEESREDDKEDMQSAEQSKEDDTTDEVKDTKSDEEKEGDGKSEESEEVSGGNCPPSDKVSCQAGASCAKNSECSDDEICCPNKCYRKQCVAPTSESEEDKSETKGAMEEAEDESEESVEVGNCPSSDKIPCGSGEKCGRNRDCSDGEICCTNKCYRKQCTPPSEGSEENTTEAAIVATQEPEDQSEESAEVGNCPLSDKIPCGSGDKCGRNRDCINGEICCTNKCYRKQCTPPAEESAEDTVISKKTESTEEEQEESEESEEETRCPPSDQIVCGSSQKCGSKRECDSGEVCCPNKCYRKQCVSPVEQTTEEISKAKAGTKTKEKAIEPEAAVSEESEEENDCPAEVPCNSGQKCGGNRDCKESEICCPTKCYRKECVSFRGHEEVSEKQPIIKEKQKEVKVKVPETKVVKPVSVVEEVRKVPAKKVTREVKKPVEYKEDDIDTSIETGGEAPVEDLSLDTDIPTNLRSRDHVEHLLKLDRESSDTEEIINKVSEITLKELKKLYENAIKPLEGLYKYRDLSNRHFGDAEIFSKPLILFMGPWSGGKSSIINYLVNNEYNETSLRTGAEPSPAYFNILMYGEEPEVIDGTELAADFTFSGLQKFGQGLEERLRGVKLPSKLLEKVNIVEIPGILEVRKQVSRVFPFNDACQWFIDRADIIFLVYDPSKLDVGPETEAILDQLKGREHQTRIILNKADQVKPEELMRVQGALIWNISPLMSSPQPPVMYTTSLWSRPFEPWAPARLLQAQERAFLRDFRTAVEKRIENKIASARRFAVRVRNHAKMVDCYLTTYYNHKSVFGNRKQVANEIIEHPQDYHIYEGLSTLTNISRYDLPDPDVYKDFFKLNPLYDFQQLSATCTYFRGCPINRLDIAIAYDLPELVGTHKKNVEEALATGSAPQEPATPGS